MCHSLHLECSFPVTLPPALCSLKPGLLGGRLSCPGGCRRPPWIHCFCRPLSEDGDWVFSDDNLQWLVPIRVWQLLSCLHPRESCGLFLPVGQCVDSRPGPKALGTFRASPHQQELPGSLDARFSSFSVAFSLNHISGCGGLTPGTYLCVTHLIMGGQMAPLRVSTSKTSISQSLLSRQCL